MFNALRGVIVSRSLDSVCLDTNGIEWELAVPATMVDELGRIGSEARVLVYLQHREDAMRLFGFPDERSRSRFLSLLKVDGVGPKQALRILSGILPDALDLAIEAEDVQALERVPGVGKKTAQKIILALKGKLASPPADRDGTHDDVVDALVEMGFERKAAREAVLAAVARHGGDESATFRTALVSLSGGS